MGSSKAQQLAQQVEQEAKKQQQQRSETKTPESAESQATSAGRKGFAGFKATLAFNGEGLAVQTEIRFEKLKAEDIVKIIRRSPSGLPVIGKYGAKQYFEATESGEPGNEIQEQDIKYYQVVEGGEEIEVGKFQRTKILETIALIDRSKLEDYLFESIYEIWSENIATLWRITEWLDREDKCVASQYSFGGFKASTAIIYPIIDRDQGRFVLVMGLTNAKKIWKHLMDVNGRDAAQKQESSDGKAKPKIKVVL